MNEQLRCHLDRKHKNVMSAIAKEAKRSLNDYYDVKEHIDNNCYDNLPVRHISLCLLLVTLKVFMVTRIV